jgi:hypothetical protein
MTCRGLLQRHDAHAALLAEGADGCIDRSSDAVLPSMGGRL